MKRNRHIGLERRDGFDVGRDHRLTWPERELVRQLGERLYGKLPAVREVHND
ncbi:hypothetical protein ACROSR_15975 [Roseovarius tibetensis]|uniref:hypothetical protein n=1 Tax=Roseovarius tibetensis TaxID=2685897 RepID=UPI003D7F4FA1